MKSADAFSRNGFRVEVLGAWTIPILKARDEELLGSLPFKFTSVADLTSGGLSRMRRRMRSKLGHMAQQFANVENRWQLGYFYSELFKATFRRNADLYIAHSEQAMAVTVDLLRAGRRVGVDMEDWFSEDLLPNARRHRPLRWLRSLERELLVGGAYASCPSRAMSTALAEEFGCRAPAVLYNAFGWELRQLIDGLHKDRRDVRVPSIHWFSQTLGPGRGLEDLLAALPFVEHNVEVHLRGNQVDGIKGRMLNDLPEGIRNRIFFHDLVSNEELLSRIAEHDIGFAGEMTYCLSRDLTITNKILQYLVAGLAVVASDTAGQREVAAQAPNAVLLYPSGDAVALAARLNALLASPDQMQRARTAALEAAKQTFSWEHQEKVLLETVARALTKKVTYKQSSI